MSSFIYGPFFDAKIHGEGHKLDVEITSEVGHVELHRVVRVLWMAMDSERG